MRDDTVAAIARGNPHASGARFLDYWMGAGSWAAMPEPRREAVATAMGGVTAEWDAAFREPTPLSAFASLDVPVLCHHRLGLSARSRGGWPGCSRRPCRA